MPVRQFTREELYALVWSKAVVQVAADLGISDVGLKKICERNGIPVPPRGYWRKLETGMKLKPTPLPKAVRAGSIQITVNEATRIDDQEDEQRLKALLAYEADPANAITVNAGLVRPHMATLLVQKRFLKATPDEYGAVRCVDKGLPYVRVPPGSVDRAVLILDALLKAFEARGYGLVEGKGTQWDASARVLIEGEALEFSIEESARRQHYRPTAKELAETKRRGWARYPLYDYVPSGVLAIKHGSYGSAWKDLSKRKVEDRLNEVIAGLTKVAFENRQRKRESAERDRQRKSEEERRAELRRIREEEEQAVAKLEEDAGTWVRARDIRAYIDAAERNPQQTFSTTEEKEAWLTWARAYADWLDPLTPSPPSILDMPKSKFQPIGPYWGLDEREW